jgi:hypothetical protein
MGRTPKRHLPEDPVFGRLFFRGLNCINKVFKKRFWSQKFTFNSRINPQENFLSTFFPFFSFYLVFLWN